jgi:hypothetical protein
MKYKRYILLASLLYASFAMGQQISNTYQWMTVGSLHTLLSNYGNEYEIGRTGRDADQSDGCRWPGIYRSTDMQAWKGLWLGATNYSETYNGAPVTWDAKVVHIGPRPTVGKMAGESFPVLFQMISKYPQTLVNVDGTPTFSIQVNPDAVDPNLKYERIIDNVVNTPIGLTIHRKVIGSGQQFHDNYLIYDYVFTNTGIIDAAGTKRANQTLNGVTLYFSNRWGVNKDAQPVIGDPIAYGKNCVNDVRGETATPGAAKYFSTNTDNNDLRVSYAWHGNYPSYTRLDNSIGGPILTQATGHMPGDTIGRLAAYQFVGWATLHADKSTHDTTDDRTQPSTTAYESSDGPWFKAGAMDQYNAPVMQQQMIMMTKGHMLPRQADALGSILTDPAMGTSGGMSTAIGYGPYTIAQSESLHIVIAEVAAGLTREAAVQIGRAYKSNPAPGALISYNGISKTKNDWVFTGKDSLFQTVRRAVANYASGYKIPQPPPPPLTFNVNSGAGKIHLEWTPPTDQSKIAGWQVWRAIGQYDSTYYKVWEGPASATSYDDNYATIDAAYYYYLVSVGYPSDNNGVGATPSGALSCSRYYTQTYAPAYRRVAASPLLIKSAVRIVPNPYNINTTSAALWPGQPEKVVFKNIPGICTIKIFSELGELINTVNHTRGDGSEDYFLTTSYGQKIVTGLYIAVIETPSGERGIYKFVVIR